MRWLVICLLVSLGGLLIAAAGVAHHIWRQHRKRRPAMAVGREEILDRTAEPVEEFDRES